MDINIEKKNKSVIDKSKNIFPNNLTPAMSKITEENEIIPIIQR